MKVYFALAKRASCNYLILFHSLMIAFLFTGEALAGSIPKDNSIISKSKNYKAYWRLGCSELICIEGMRDNKPVIVIESETLEFFMARKNILNRMLGKKLKKKILRLELAAVPVVGIANGSVVLIGEYQVVKTKVLRDEIVIVEGRYFVFNEKSGSAIAFKSNHHSSSHVISLKNVKRIARDLKLSNSTQTYSEERFREKISILEAAREKKKSQSAQVSLSDFSDREIYRINNYFYTKEYDDSNKLINSNNGKKYREVFESYFGVNFIPRKIKIKYSKSYNYRVQVLSVKPGACLIVQV